MVLYSNSIAYALIFFFLFLSLFHFVFILNLKIFLSLVSLILELVIYFHVTFFFKCLQHNCLGNVWVCEHVENFDYINLLSNSLPSWIHFFSKANTVYRHFFGKIYYLFLYSLFHWLIHYLRREGQESVLVFVDTVRRFTVSKTRMIRVHVKYRCIFVSNEIQNQLHVLISVILMRKKKKMF